MQGFFKSAEPIWAKSRQREMNVTFGISAAVSGSVALRITASCLYRVFLNGKLAAYGPARAAHGYFRVDEWHLDCRENSHLYIEAAGYNVNGFYTLDQPSFVQAEIEENGNITAATGVMGFSHRLVTERVKKVPRYSFQRAFCEAWNLGADYYRPYSGAVCDNTEVEICPEVKYLPRIVNYPTFTYRTPRKITSSGSATDGHKREVYQRDRSVTDISEKLKGFTMDDMELFVSDLAQEIDYIYDATGERRYNGETLSFCTGKFYTLEFERDYAGFISFRINAEAPCRLWVLWDECLSGNDVEYTRHCECVNAIPYTFEKGEYTVTSFEAYSIKAIKFVLIEGKCEIDGIRVIDYIAPVPTKKDCPVEDPEIKAIYDAAVYAYEACCLESFMDGASRERNSSLMDSFFMARAEGLLTGSHAVEHNLFENYMLADHEYLKPLAPDMIPCFYPAEHYDGLYVPAHAMWFVLQLCEYVKRTGDRETALGLKDWVYRSKDFFMNLINSDGLIENLPGWVFLDWSGVSAFTSGVNYPYNFMFAKVLDAMDELYGDKELARIADNIRKVAYEQSFDGELFIDNAVRQGDELHITENRSELAQIYAFWFGAVTPESHPKLWNKIVNEYGPDREYREVPCSTYSWPLRLDLLAMHGETDELLRSLKGYFGYMVKDTGTLWEHPERTNNMCEGLNSHIIYVLDHLR